MLATRPRRTPVSDRRALLAAVAITAVLTVMAPAAAPAATITTTGAPDAANLAAALSAFPPAALTTGRLDARAIPLVDLAAHDGSPAAAAATPFAWRQSLHQLAAAAVDPADAARLAAALADARALAAANMAAGLHTLAVLDLAYDHLDPRPLTSGAIAYDEAAGAFVFPADPAVARTLVDARHATLAAALSPTIHDGAAATFVLPRDLVVTAAATAGADIDIDIDFADGAGLRAVTPDAPITVRYDATGPRTLTARVTAADGRTRWSSFQIDVATLVTPVPSETWNLTASMAYDGAYATGQAFILLAPGHTQVTDPVVVVEGFDLDDSLGWPELYALLNQENLIEDLRAAGRDAVVLNFTEATVAIQRNAFLLVELLQTIDAMVPAGATYPVIGASMGGLVTRFALAWMENSGAGHHCHTFVSFDSPHTGANVPLGLQCYDEFFADQAFLLSRLDSPAARQMVLYHHLMIPQGVAGPDPAYDQLRADYAAIGDWPQQPRLVSVINGSSAGQGQTFGPAAQLIEYEYYSFFVDIIGNAWAVPDQNGSQTIFQGVIDQIWPLPDTEWTVTASNTTPWDSSPGGWRDSIAQAGAAEAPYGDIIALHDNHAFVPSVGAAGLTGVDPYTPLSGIADFPPFDVVYMPAANQDHVSITPENRQWFMDEILGSTTAVGHDDAAGAVPVAVTLRGAAPNPFNPRTTVGFALPSAGVARLWVADLRGHHVRTLVDDRLPAGEHAAAWDGRDDTGRSVSAGVYLAIVEHDGHRVAQRLALVK